MTPKYWAGILAGMLVIFVAGLFVARGVRRGRDFVTNTLPGSLPLLAAGFHVDGDRIGDIQRLHFMRSQPGRVDSAVITVKLGANADTQRVESCALRVEHAEPFGGDTRFLCTSSADSLRLGLVPFGHVEFLPDGKQVALFVARDGEEALQLHAYHGAGGHDSGDVDIRAANDTFTVTVDGREIIRISGTDNGGSLVIRGANGRPIVEIGGDSAGGSVKITDANGKTRVDIHGANTGGNTSAGNPRP
ncbi:MAG: hypothetical protein ACRELE_04085 [Gemmatimonadales bacterium]